MNHEDRKSTDSAGSGQMALLAILRNVLFSQTNGKTLTAEEMQGLIERADLDKLKKARVRLAQAAEPEMPSGLDVEGR